MPKGDVKSHHVRSSGGGRSRSRGSSYRSSSKSYSYVAPAMTAEQRAAMDAKFAREKLERDMAEVDEITLMQSQSVQLTGHLHSEVAAAIASRERYGLPEGDFLDDPVEAAQGRPGFGEEYSVKRGIRLLVNIAVDCSNSMRHNSLEDSAKAATYTLYAMLDNIARLLPEGTLTTTVWQWARNKGGDGVDHMTGREMYNRNALLSPQQKMVDAIHDIWMDGEDTYIAPLFRALHNYEVSHGWQGQARLDIILTDGVLEHRADVKEATRWQLERNGGLNTVMLNFLPIAEWAEVYLPDRCYQYEATPDNVFNLMTKVLGDWIMMV